jgi:transcription-repair coupling factor (superfamily II helicase)
MKVMEHGEFSVKGSLIDIYPMGAKLPCRLDLFDQEIESIRLFDGTAHQQLLPLFDLTKQLLFLNKNLLHRQRQPVKILTSLLVSAVDLIIS